MPQFFAEVQLQRLVATNSELLAAQETIAQQAATIAELKAQLKAV